MFDLIDSAKVCNFGHTGLQRLKNVTAHLSIYKSGFASENKDFEKKVSTQYIYDLNLDRHIYPDPVKDGKIVISFPELHISLISYRTCYETEYGIKHPTEIIMEKGTKPRMIIEVYCMLYDKKQNGDFRPMFPIILQASGYKAQVLKDAITLFAGQINYVWPNQY